MHRKGYIKINKIIVFLLVAISGYFVYKNVFNKKKAVEIDLKNALSQTDIIPVVILGSGPAGQSAGIYATRLGFKSLIIEGHKAGGQLTETTFVENWPGEQKILGKDLMNKLHEHNKHLGTTFLHDDVTKVDFSSWPFKIFTQDGHKINALSVIIATGSSPRLLNIPGEKKYWGKGVTTCAICDAPFYKNKNVAVIGGGDSAAEQVLQLAEHVNHITMFVRGNKFRASQAMQDRLSQINNLKVLYQTQINEIIGNDHVNAIEVFDNRTNSKYQMPIDGVFLAIGHEPNTALFNNQLEMDKAGYIALDGRSQKTSINGVFAAGDVEDHVYMQAGIASGSGIKAALDASSFLHSIGVNKSIENQLENKYFEPLDSGESVVLSITTYNELRRILSEKQPVILDFWAEYCPSCKHMLPAFESVAKKMQGKMKFVKIDSDKSKELVEKLYVLKVPTFIVYKEGQIVARNNDVMDKSKLAEFVSKYI